MAGVETITHLINSPPGVLAAGGVLAGIVWTFFERVGNVLNEETNQEAYWQVSYTRRMKSRTEYVRQECVKELRRRIATHKRFKRLIDQWIDLSIEHSRLTMQMAESEDS